MRARGEDGRGAGRGWKGSRGAPAGGSGCRSDQGWGWKGSGAGMEGERGEGLIRAERRSQEAGRKREERMSHQKFVHLLLFLVVGDFTVLLSYHATRVYF